MTLSEVREYFKTFKCEVLTSSEDNKAEIQCFSSEIRNNKLADYLKTAAWDHDIDGVTRVYLIREPSGQIVLFFSLKCGAVFTTNALDDRYSALIDAEKKFVKDLVNARLNKNDDLYYRYVESSKELFPTNHELLRQIAEHRFRKKNEAREAGDEISSLKVDACYSAIELQHFCRCDDFHLSSDIPIPLGFGLFWEQIVPVIEDIASKVGCEYLYLFAADRSENPEDCKLVSYYKSSLSFIDIEDEGVTVLKPSYDDNCIGLLQKINQLSNTREYAWALFSDHIAT